MLNSCVRFRIRLPTITSCTRVINLLFFLQAVSGIVDQNPEKSKNLITLNFNDNSSQSY